MRERAPGERWRAREADTVGDSHSERLLESLAGGLSLNERQVRLVGTRLECAGKTEKKRACPSEQSFLCGEIIILKDVGTRSVSVGPPTG